MRRALEVATATAALLTLLSYTWWHTGGLLAQFVQPAVLGYTCAAGIEMSVVAMMLRIGARQRAGQRRGWLFAVLIAALVVSAGANLAEGHRTYTGDTLTVARFAALDAVWVVLSVAATALISGIVLALSEVVGADVRATTKPPARSIAEPTEPVSQPARYACDRCGSVFAVQQQYAAHRRRCQRGTDAHGI